MKNSTKIETLTKEFIDLMKKGNIALTSVTIDPTKLMDHPDFEKAIDILTALDEAINEDSSI